MATPNYAFAKHQREIAKKKKKEDKKLKKAGALASEAPVDLPAAPPAEIQSP